MDRAEATGFGVAFAGHAALLAALAAGFAAVKVPQIRNQPIEVAFVDEVGLESTAPIASAEMPAPKLAEIEGPPEPVAAPVPEPLPAPPQLQPQPQPRAITPQPAPRPQPKAAPKAAPAPPKAQPQPKATRPTGRLSGLLDGVGDTPSKSKAATPPASTAGPAVQASLVGEIRRQIRPHWQRAAPTGADVEKLRTEITISLSRSGAVTDVQVGSTSGQTTSNRPQVALHRERAVRAVQLAAPYELPAEYYDAWKRITISLDLRLAQ